MKALTVRFGGLVALDHVDLEVAGREVISVLGPSGCGKSTLLRAIAGLERPSDGRVMWDDHDLADVAPHRRGFGLMFQDHALFPHQDVLGNVAFGLRMQRLPASDIDTRSREVLRLVGLEDAAHRRVGELSGGEQQRVALARSLAPRPKLLMLDEPFGSLDRTLRERLLLELRELFVRLGVTVLSVTHDHDEAFALADRVVVMRAGRIEQVGPPQAVWQRPATEFVARFLGFDNVVEAVVRGETVTSPWGSMPAPGIADGGAHVVARPEAVHISADGPIRGEVTLCTFRRDHFLVRVETPAGSSIEAVVAPDRLPPIGATVGLRLDPETAIVFPT